MDGTSPPVSSSPYDNYHDNEGHMSINADECHTTWRQDTVTSAMENDNSNSVVETEETPNGVDVALGRISIPETGSRVGIIIWAASWQSQQCGCASSEDSDQPWHPPSLIRVFAVCMKKAWVLSYPLSAQRRLRSDWADAQADLSLRCAHSHIVGFVMSRLIFIMQLKI